MNLNEIQIYYDILLYIFFLKFSPEGYTCDTDEGRCKKGELSMALFKKSKSIKSENNIVCPDNTSECPEGTTCCLMDDDSYGCCPIPK